MSTAIELPIIEYQHVSSRCSNLDNLTLNPRLDLSNPELRRRIESHKYMVSEAVGRDIGYVVGVIGYFIDNPSHLPVMQDRTDKLTLNFHHCFKRQKAEVFLLPIAVSQHQYLMGKPVSPEEAWTDFKKSGHYDEWRLRFDAAVPICLCAKAEYCADCHKAYGKLQARKKQEQPLIPIDPQKPDKMNSGLVGLISILDKH
jgi:hypothetical protein